MGVEILVVVKSLPEFVAFDLIILDLTFLLVEVVRLASLPNPLKPQADSLELVSVQPSLDEFLDHSGQGLRLGNKDFWLHPIVVVEIEPQRGRIMPLD